jgi:SpoVK/Ycf46/Vps4 family AAA+-type ATPase
MAATANTNSNDTVDAVEAILGANARVEVSADDPKIKAIEADLRLARVLLALSKRGIAIERSGNVVTVFRVGARPSVAAAVKADNQPPVATATPPADKNRHTSRPYVHEKDVLSIVADSAAPLIQFVGPTGCGKTFEARRVAELTGRKFFKLSCHGDMSEKDIFGEKTVEIDAASGQNVVVFKAATLVQAMLCGLDENGNETGAPALLVIDEYPALPPHLGIAMNPLFECDDPRRCISVEADGGRQVRSHSGLRIIMTGNNAAGGATTMQEALYTAQGDAQDVSTRLRVDATFRFGYDKKLEKAILMEKVGDDKIVLALLRFRDMIRGHIKTGRLMTPFGTRQLVQIATLYRIYGDLGKAVYLNVMNKLGADERAVYNETFHAVTTRDLLKEYEDNDPDVDYM